MNKPSIIESIFSCALSGNRSDPIIFESKEEAFSYSDMMNLRKQIAIEWEV